MLNVDNTERPSAKFVEKSVGDIDDGISFGYWLKGGILGLFVAAIPVAIGLCSPHADVPHVLPSGVTPADLVANPGAAYALWYEAWGPMLLFLIVQIVGANLLAPVLGYDMIQERSVNIEIKDSMRSNLTSQALVAALYLTVVVAMLQVDPPTEDPGALVNQWYVCLLVVAAFMTMTALTVNIICLIYIEPLSDQACLKLISYGLMYFGEPMALCAVAFIDTTIAMVLWVFGTYGLGAGLIGCTALVYCITRVYVVYHYFAAWENDELDADARRVREEWKNQHAHVGHVAKKKPPGAVNDPVEVALT